MDIANFDFLLNLVDKRFKSCRKWRFVSLYTTNPFSKLQKFSSKLYQKSLAIMVNMDELYHLFTLSDKSALIVWLNRSNTIELKVDLVWIEFYVVANGFEL